MLQLAAGEVILQLADAKYPYILDLRPVRLYSLVRNRFRFRPIIRLISNFRSPLGTPTASAERTLAWKRGAR